MTDLRYIYICDTTTRTKLSHIKLILDRLHSSRTLCKLQRWHSLHWNFSRLFCDSRVFKLNLWVVSFEWEFAHVQPKFQDEILSGSAYVRWSRHGRERNDGGILKILYGTIKWAIHSIYVIIYGRFVGEHFFIELEKNYYNIILVHL